MLQGITSVILQLVFFASPVLVLKNVVRMKDSSQIYTPLAVTTVANCFLWSGYGLVIGGLLLFSE